MNRTVELKYGRGRVSFDIARERLIGIIEPNPEPAVHDVEKSLRKAIEDCYGPRLEDVIKKDSRVLILTVDITRPSPKALLNVIEQRLKDLGAKVEVMVGLGMHRPMTPKELEKHIGKANVLQNEANGPMWSGGVTSFGTPIEVDERVMDYDARIAIGFVEPTYLLGFTGGRKIIMPGVASEQAIAHNHFLLLSPGRKLGVLDGNPLSEDAIEFARAVGLHWIVDVALNPDDTYSGIFCGDMEKANRAACKMSAKIYEHRFSKEEQKADIVVASAGGYPYDFDLCQTKKSMVPAMECVKPGGTIILVGECPDGWGVEDQSSRRSLTKEDPKNILSDLYERFEKRDCSADYEAVPSSSAYLFSKAVAEQNCQLIAVTGINEDLKHTFIEVAPSITKALEISESRLGKNTTVTVIPDGRRIIPVFE